MSLQNQNITTKGRSALDELWESVQQFDAIQLQPVIQAIGSAEKIVLHGVGREGLMMQAMAMRFFHLGLDAHVLGDMTTPPVGSDDLLIVSAGPGYFSSIAALVNNAQTDGAKVVCITAQPEAKLPKQADLVLTIPAQTMADDLGTDKKHSVLPMGSLYEGALFIYGELIVLELQKILAASKDDMRSRHTNLE